MNHHNIADVATINDPDFISKLKLDDKVWAYNEDTGEVGTYPVTATFKHLDPEIVELTIDDETITTTPGHLFYTDEGWVAAGDLVVGDEIHSLNGDDGTVTVIEIVAAHQWMDDLTVDEAHTFFVGEGWLVHNQNPDDPTPYIKIVGNLFVGRYGFLSGKNDSGIFSKSGLTAHHLNQDAAFDFIIPSEDHAL